MIQGLMVEAAGAKISAVIDGPAVILGSLASPATGIIPVR
jgi:hypothetical protein